MDQEHDHPCCTSQSQRDRNALVLVIGVLVAALGTVIAWFSPELGGAIVVGSALAGIALALLRR
ncbi:hypothetical protein DMH26_17630 [Streptomyces sp. WAC 05379]|uniref:hypothetical protein n=1 Tax=Streptomyces sp. WAC 05379 TaxID=2203207 RepID=UPI000F736FC3|nr:hypothetical protein [Streptomyces sp. WAC 05379]RSN99944.1 hypothetical protein DMH26_17630 [Streptomyces sp. WAC 05379]